MCPEDVTSHPEEEEEAVDDAGAVLPDDDSPGYQDVSPLAVFERCSPPQRSVSESELTRVRLIAHPEIIPAVTNGDKSAFYRTA